MPIGHVAPGNQGDQDEGRQHEEQSGEDAACAPVHEPTEVGGKLLSLGAGQQHAVVERMHEALFGDPAPALDQMLMHERDLPGWSAKADKAELEPEHERIAKRDRRRRGMRRWWIGDGGSRVGGRQRGIRRRGHRVQSRMHCKAQSIVPARVVRLDWPPG